MWAFSDLATPGRRARPEGWPEDALASKARLDAGRARNSASVPRRRSCEPAKGAACKSSELALEREMIARTGLRAAVPKLHNIDRAGSSHYSAAPSGDLCTTSKRLFQVGLFQISRRENRRSVRTAGDGSQHGSRELRSNGARSNQMREVLSHASFPQRGLSSRAASRVAGAGWGPSFPAVFQQISLPRSKFTNVEHDVLGVSAQVSRSGRQRNSFFT